MFEVTGKIDGITCSLKYVDGVLSGDDIAIQKAERENKKDHGGLGMPPNVKSDYLEGENAGYSLIVAFVFDEVISQSNDWIEIPEDWDV